jgi:aspartate/methionine/tyrosine aminotransferase
MEEGIIVAPGRSFGPGGEANVRVALVPCLEECREAVRIWESLAVRDG